MMKLNRKLFYDQVRSGPFPNRLSKQQVDGMENLLNVWERFYARQDKRFLAYCLATACVETAWTMQPIYEYGNEEYFQKYDPEFNPAKAAQLGNTSPGDGYRYRGAGHVQNTGRRNARVSSERLNKAFPGLEVNFERNPDMRLEPELSAHCLFLGCIEGWWTNHSLRTYINSVGTDFVNARRVVNGLDRAEEIARYAHQFLEAIELAGEEEKRKEEEVGEENLLKDFSTVDLLSEVRRRVEKLEGKEK